MAKDVAVKIAGARENTRRITCDLPVNGPRTLDLHRETVLFDADSNVVSALPWRHIHRAADVVAGMQFKRPDGSSFSGADLMADMAIACDAIADRAAAEDAEAEAARLAAEQAAERIAAESHAKQAAAAPADGAGKSK